MWKLEGIPEILIDECGLLSIADFRKMDTLAIGKYALPIELMMENAGLQLARLTSLLLPDTDKKILIGVGSGNNGGGGLVAARRLAGGGTMFPLTFRTSG